MGTRRSHATAPAFQPSSGGRPTVTQADPSDLAADAPRLADFAGYGTSFFELRAGQAAGVLMIFTAVAFAAVAVRALRRLS
jgi:hypothetical protein